jgi:TrmH family RNA methyltransferase
VTRPTPTSSRSDWARAARRLANKSFRDQVGRFLVEGPQAVRELVEWHPAAVAEVVVSDEANRAAIDVAAIASEAGCDVTTVPEEVLVAVTETVSPQGVAAVCSYLDSSVVDLLRPRPELKLAVFLHEVRDPGNAGTVLRAADAAGAQAVMFGADSVDPYNGKCVRSSAGSIFHTNFSRGTPVAQAIDLAREAGLTILATDLNADLELGDALCEPILSQPALWLFGSEAHGLPESLRDRADYRIRIPIFGAAESLNLATAAAVCLYAGAFAARS